MHRHELATQLVLFSSVGHISPFFTNNPPTNIHNTWGSFRLRHCGGTFQRLTQDRTISAWWRLKKSLVIPVDCFHAVRTVNRFTRFIYQNLSRLLLIVSDQFNGIWWTGAHFIHKSLPGNHPAWSTDRDVRWPAGLCTAHGNHTTMYRLLLLKPPWPQTHWTFSFLGALIFNLFHFHLVGPPAIRFQLYANIMMYANECTVMYLRMHISTRL